MSKHTNLGNNERADELAKDVASSVDDETLEAVEGDLKNDRRKHAKDKSLADLALEDARDAADMVSEGAPVDESVEDPEKDT